MQRGLKVHLPRPFYSAPIYVSMQRGLKDVFDMKSTTFPTAEVSMQRGLKVFNLTALLNRSTTVSQCKEDWKSSTQLTTSATASKVSMQRGLKDCGPRHRIYLSKSSLNAKRIESLVPHLVATPALQMSQCKEDWKSYIGSGGDSVVSKSSQCKEDWKLYVSVGSITAFKSSLNAKRIEREMSVDMYFFPKE